VDQKGNAQVKDQKRKVTVKKRVRGRVLGVILRKQALSCIWPREPSWKNYGEGCGHDRNHWGARGKEGPGEKFQIFYNTGKKKRRQV